MLALRRMRYLLHSVPESQTRYLGTRPRPLPTYVKQWNPTLRNTGRPPKVSREVPRSNEPSQCNPEQGPLDDAKVELRSGTDQQYLPEDVVISVGSHSSRITHSVKKLEHVLNLADSRDDLDPSLRAPLWTAYTQAMKHKVSLPKYLPPRAWNIIWRSQYAYALDVPLRSTHLSKLDRDHCAARASPVAGQVAYRIERDFMAGMQEQALDTWTTNRKDFAMAPDYLDTGVRLYGLAGHPDTARNIMDHLFQMNPGWNPSVMLVVFRAYTSSGSEQHLTEARAIYHAIKHRLGSEGALSMYNSCLVGFLEARSLPDAKQVFQDMVCGGHLSTKDSEGSIKEVLRKLNMLYALATDVSSMSGIALSAIAILPTAYHGHIFSDWMKFAMVEKAPQAAAQVLNTMIQRGYQPETDDFNLLLRTLFRTKEPENILKAENIGWKMIEEVTVSTINAERHPLGSRVKAIADKLQNTSVLDTDGAITTPPASPSTFGLIMRHHASNSQWEHVDYLARQLKLANVEPDVIIMNVLIDNKCHKGLFSEAWQVYTSLTNTSGVGGTVFPDGQTIRMLWRVLRLALSDPANREDPNLPTPRKLLRETFEWWILVRQRPDMDRFLQGLTAETKGALTKLMLHSFSYAQDLPGTLVALHFLRQKFKVYITRETAMTVFRQQAWKAMHNETESVRRQFGRSQNHARTLQRLTQTYDQLFKNRLQRLGITDDTLQTYSKEQRSDLELNLISEFIRVILLAEHDPETVEILIHGAAKAAGVPYMATGDVTALDMIELL